MSGIGVALAAIAFFAPFPACFAQAPDFGPPAGPGAEPPLPRLAFEYVDTHVHATPARDGVASLAQALQVMAETRIGRMVILPTPQAPGMRFNWDYESFLPALRAHPGRFAFLGGGGSLNPMVLQAATEGRVEEALRARFEKRARQILDDGASGFGELSAHHLSLMPGHPYEQAPADHPLFLLLADIAAEHSAVIDFHFDVVAADMPRPARLGPPNPEILRANLAGFERLLAHNRGARIVWAHAGSDPLGQHTAQLSRELLSRHPNLHLSIRVGSAAGGVLNPMMLPGIGVNPEWLGVLEAYPDRFVLGGDQFFFGGPGSAPGAEFARRAPLQRRAQAVFLSRLPPALARRIGYENALQLYRFDR